MSPLWQTYPTPDSTSTGFTADIPMQDTQTHTGACTRLRCTTTHGPTCRAYLLLQGQPPAKVHVLQHKLRCTRLLQLLRSLHVLQHTKGFRGAIDDKSAIQHVASSPTRNRTKGGRDLHALHVNKATVFCNFNLSHTYTPGKIASAH